MEIKIIKDGLKNKDGGPLHTYEYNLKDKEIIDVYHLSVGENVVWESATKGNMMAVGNKEKQNYTKGRPYWKRKKNQYCDRNSWRRTGRPVRLL